MKKTLTPAEITAHKYLKYKNIKPTKKLIDIFIAGQNSINENKNTTSLPYDKCDNFKLYIEWNKNHSYISWDMDTDKIDYYSKPDYVRFVKTILPDKNDFLTVYNKKINDLTDLFNKEKYMDNKENIEKFCFACFKYVFDNYDNAIPFTIEEQKQLGNKFKKEENIW
jgi:hypothetical protein